MAPHTATAYFRFSLSSDQEAEGREASGSPSLVFPLLGDSGPARVTSRLYLHLGGKPSGLDTTGSKVSLDATRPVFLLWLEVTT